MWSSVSGQQQWVVQLRGGVETRRASIDVERGTLCFGEVYRSSTKTSALFLLLLTNKMSIDNNEKNKREKV